MHRTPQSLCGWEVEFGIHGPHLNERTRGQNAAAIFNEIAKSGSVHQAPEEERIYLLNGSQFYLDGYHPEMACAERGNPVLATLTRFADQKVLRRTLSALNAQLPPDTPRYRLLAYNFDALDVSIGAHINHMVDSHFADLSGATRALLQSVCATRIPLIGNGHLENSGPNRQLRFGMSQRIRHSGDAFRTAMISSYYGKISDHLADTTFSQRSAVIAAGQFSAVLAMIQAGIDLDDLILYDAANNTTARALRANISFDLDMTNTYELTDGRTITVLEHQAELNERIRRYFLEVDNPFDDEWSMYTFLDAQDTALRQLEADPSPNSVNAKNFDWQNKLSIFNEQATGFDGGWSNKDFQLWAQDFNRDYHDLGIDNSSLHGGQIFAEEELIVEIAEPAPETSASARRLIVDELNQTREAGDISIGWNEIRYRINGKRYKLELPDPAHNTATELKAYTGDSHGREFLQVIESLQSLPENPLEIDAKADRAQRYRSLIDLALTARVDPPLNSRETQRVAICNVAFGGIIETNQRGDTTYIASTATQIEYLRTLMHLIAQRSHVAVDADRKPDGTVEITAPETDRKIVIIPFSLDVWDEVVQDMDGKLDRKQMLSIHSRELQLTRRTSPTREIDF